MNDPLVLPTRRENGFLAFCKRNKSALIQYGSLLLVMMFFATSTQGSIFKIASLRTLLKQTAPLMIIACGLIFVFAHGGMDISVGAVIGLDFLVVIAVVNSLGPKIGGVGAAWIGLLVSLLLCMAIYAINCLASIYFRIMSTISSLAVMFICRGIQSFFVSKTTDTIELSANYSDIFDIFSSNYLFISLLCLAFAAVCLYLFRFTALGKYSKAIGDNETAAKQSGANVVLVKLIDYLVAGFAVGLATIFLLARVGSVSENTGSGKEMDVIIIIILGGMALSGGESSRMSAGIIGALTYSLLSLGLSIMRVDSNYVSLVKAAIFFAIIALTLTPKGRAKFIPR